jgi:hypothetical protein
MEDVNMNSDSNTISQGTPAVAAEPKTLEEVKQADAAWFAENPDRQYHVRKSYPCEPNRWFRYHIKNPCITLLEQVKPGLRKRLLTATDSGWAYDQAPEGEIRNKFTTMEKYSREGYPVWDKDFKDDRPDGKWDKLYTDDDEAEKQEAQEKRTRKARERKERIASGKVLFTDEAFEQLPADLQLVKFKLTVEHEDDEDAIVKAALERCFGALGAVDTDGYDTTIEFVTTAALVAKYFDRDGALVQGWTLNGARFKLVGGVETADSFNKKRRNWTFRGITAPHQGAYKAGDFETWVAGVAVQEETFTQLQELIVNLYNGDVVAIAADLEHRERPRQPQQFLVPGILPKGVIVQLLGMKGHGKSTIARQLCAAVAAREAEWLGFKLDHSADNGGVILYLSAEDTDTAAEDDIKKMLGVSKLPTRIIVLPMSKQHGDLETVLKRFKPAKVALLVVDPARAWMGNGDEDSSGVVSAFFNVIFDFVMAKNWGLSRPLLN